MDLVFSLYRSPKVGHFQGVVGVTRVTGPNPRRPPTGRNPLAAFQVFNLGIRGPEGVDAIVGRRDLCELPHVRRFGLRLYRFHRVGLTLPPWGRTKAIGDRLTTLLADARAAERLKYPGLWCLGWPGGDLRAQSLLLLPSLAGKESLPPCVILHGVIRWPEPISISSLFVSNPRPLFLRHYLGSDARLLSASQ